MILSIYMKGDYEEFHALRRQKNKANSKPIRQERIAGQVYQRSMFSIRSPKDCVPLWSPYGQRTASRWGRKDYGRFNTRQSSLVLSCFGLSAGGKRKIVRNIRLIRRLGQFSAKKRLHLSGGSDTIHNIRGLCRRRPALGSRARCPRHACKNVIQPHCRLVGGK